MYYIYKCVCVLVTGPQKQFQLWRNIQTDSDLEKVDCYLSAALRWFRLGNASGENSAPFFLLLISALDTVSYQSAY